MIVDIFCKGGKRNLSFRVTAANQWVIQWTSLTFIIIHQVRILTTWKAIMNFDIKIKRLKQTSFFGQFIKHRRKAIKKKRWTHTFYIMFIDYQIYQKNENELKVHFLGNVILWPQSKPSSYNVKSKIFWDKKCRKWIWIFVCQHWSNMHSN